MFWMLLLPVASAARFLAPNQDIVLWDGKNAANPLSWLGANGPWTAGRNVFAIDPNVPEQCTVEQAFYLSRHGSRYPDKGAYGEWTEMASRFSVRNNYTATGPLSFLPSWKPVLTDPDRQIAMESPTGYKEAMDMGYQLRTRYPELYQEGDDLYVWSNNYTRVLQTAANFLHGFLGPNADTNGKLVSVTSKGFSSAIGNSLAASDSCPNFVDGNGGTQQPTWDAIWQPPIQKRLQKLIQGNLTLTLSDINLMPYLCGFESQITGQLSPFCDVFTEEELKQYQYSNDLRYYYGMGPGTDLPQIMMTPFLNSVVDLLQKGPGITGISTAGNFTLPKLLVSFLNDGQLIETITASGVFDNQSLLSPTSKDDNRLFIGSRFVTMRGTIAFERLNCRTVASKKRSAGRRSCAHNTFIRIKLNDQVYPVPTCQDGPGKSCLLSTYAELVKDRYQKQGNWAQNCNVTGTPLEVPGASFYTDLTQPHVQVINV